MKEVARMKRCRRIVEVAVICGLLAAIGGCGPNGPERVRVSGTVTYQGKPLPDGTISFVPIGKTAGLPADVAILQGQYDAKIQSGLLVGDYQVRIEAQRERSGPPQLAGGRFAWRERHREQVIPAKYNTKSELKVTIEPGHRSVTRDFVLND
jgi:hypothetical protein